MERKKCCFLDPPFIGVDAGEAVRNAVAGFEESRVK